MSIVFESDCTAGALDHSAIRAACTRYTRVPDSTPVDGAFVRRWVCESAPPVAVGEALERGISPWDAGCVLPQGDG